MTLGGDLLGTGSENSALFASIIFRSLSYGFRDGCNTDPDGFSGTKYSKSDKNQKLYSLNNISWWRAEEDTGRKETRGNWHQNKIP